MPFLDILVIRDTYQNTFSTSVYRKKTFSGVMTNWNSCTFFGYKIGVIYTTLHRCYMICSSYKHLHDQFEVCKDIFQKNGYPLSWVAIMRTAHHRSRSHPKSGHHGLKLQFYLIKSKYLSIFSLSDNIY